MPVVKENFFPSSAGLVIFSTVLGLLEHTHCSVDRPRTFPCVRLQHWMFHVRVCVEGSFCVCARTCCVCVCARVRVCVCVCARTSDIPTSLRKSQLPG